MDKELLDFEDFEISKKNANFKIKNYNSVDLSEVRNYLGGLNPGWFTYLQVTDNSKIEKVLYDYYKTDKYFDLILFLNDREMLFDMPYSSDIIIDAMERDITEYEFKVFGSVRTKLTADVRERLLKKLDDEYTQQNQKFGIIRVIRTEHIETVKRKIREILKTQKDMFTLTEV